MKKHLLFIIVWALLGFLTACDFENSTKQSDVISRYVLPSFKKADELKLKNPDSTLLLCDYMLRLTNENNLDDSLRLEIELLKAKTILNKGFEEKSMDMFKALLPKYIEKNNVFSVALINFNIADILNNFGRYNDAMPYIDKALNGFSVEKFPLQRARALSLKGLLALDLGQFKVSELCFNEALVIFGKENSLIDGANILQNLGNLHFDLKDTIVARDYYLRSAKIQEKFSDKYFLSSIYNNIGLLYRYSNPDSALYYYNKVQMPDGDNEHLRSYVISLFNKANIYKDRREFEKSREIFDEVYGICKTYNIAQGIPRVLFSYGDIEYETGHFDKALDYINQSLHWCDSLGIITLKQDILFGKISMFSMKGDYKQAFLLQQEYDAIEDSIKRNETKEAIAKSEKINQQKNKTIEDLEKKQLNASKKQRNYNILVYFLSALLFLIVLVVGFKYFRKRN
jgi:tetratricopeptide (TPR) repeat protein